MQIRNQEFELKSCYSQHFGEQGGKRIKRIAVASASPMHRLGDSCGWGGDMFIVNKVLYRSKHSYFYIYI
jgi:hypothetical protein